MSQEVSEWLVNGLYLKIGHVGVITHLHGFTNFLRHPSFAGFSPKHRLMRLPQAKLTFLLLLLLEPKLGKMMLDSGGEIVLAVRELMATNGRK